MSETLWPLPPGWAWRDFEEVAFPRLELADAKQFPDATHIAPNHIESGTGRLLGSGTVAGDKVAGPKHRFTAGQVLYSKIRPYLAKAVLAPEDGYCSSDMYPLDTSLEPGFLLRWLVCPAFTERVSQDQGRTVLPKVNLATLRKTPVPVPPPDEQRRIVAKLDSLQASSRRAREALDSIPPLLEKLRQSILAAAFRGDLTREWRAKHPDVEPASELLKRIRVERRRKWEEAELAKMVAKGKPPKDDRWKAKYEEPKPVDQTGLPELPEGWCWASVKLVTSRVTDGTHQPPPTTPSGIPFIGIRNISGNKVDWSSVDKWVAPETHRALTSQCAPEEGDLLYTAVGATFGRAVEVRAWEPFVFQRHIALLKLVREVILPSYAEPLLNAPTVFAQATLAARGAAQPTVTLGELSRFVLPIAPMSEQVTIATRLSALLERVEHLARWHGGAKERFASINEAILTKAFRGELVPRYPAEQPVSIAVRSIGDEPAATPAPAESTCRRRGRPVAPETPPSGARSKRGRRKAS